MRTGQESSDSPNDNAGCNIGKGDAASFDRGKSITPATPKDDTQTDDGE